MTVENIEEMLDELMTTDDDNLKAVKLTDIKLAIRDYKSERDEAETIKDGEITKLGDDIAERDKTINELQTANTALAQRFSEMAVRERDVEDKEEDDAYVINDLIKRFE